LTKVAHFSDIYSLNAAALVSLQTQQVLMADITDYANLKAQESGGQLVA